MSLRVLLTSVIALCCVQTVQADILNISDGGAEFRLDTDIAGGDNFVDANAADNLFRESWFVRNAGITTELTGGTASSSGNTGSVDFGEILADPVTGAGFDTAISYEIVETGDTAVLNYQLSITNNLFGDQSISVFQYFDHDVLVGGTNDISIDLSGEPTIEITGTNGSGDNAIVRRTGVGATGFQIGQFSDDIPNLISTLNDLDNSTTETLGADVAGAFQWDITIGAGETITISGSAVTAVPEPTFGWVAIGLGCVLIGRNRRR